VSLEVHAAQITLEQRNRSLLQFRGRGPVPEWAVVVQTHLMSGWPKVRIFSKNCWMKDMDASGPQVGLMGWKIVGRELQSLVFL